MALHRRNILAVTPMIPKPDQSGGDCRMVAVLEMMARNHAVDLCVVWQDPPDVMSRYETILQAKGVHTPPPPWCWAPHAFWNKPYDIGWFVFWKVAEIMGPDFRRSQPDAHVVVDTVDVHFAREEAGLAIGVGDPEQVAEHKRRELATYQAADTVITITPEDERLLKEHEISPPMRRLPIIVPKRERKPGPRACELLFIGSFNHPPNLDGILWFVNSVWPLIQKDIPEVKLTIIGSNTPREIKDLAQLPGVSVLGFVADIGPFLDRASVAIAPLRYGGGMKGKVCEAMASGLPVVTTSFGAQGIGALNGLALLMEDRPDDYAQAVVDLLTHPDKAERMGLAGQRHIQNLCSPDIVIDHLSGIIDGIDSSHACGIANSLEWRWRRFHHLNACRMRKWSQRVLARMGVAHRPRI